MRDKGNDIPPLKQEQNTDKWIFGEEKVLLAVKNMKTEMRNTNEEEDKFEKPSSKRAKPNFRLENSKEVQLADELVKEQNLNNSFPETENYQHNKWKLPNLKTKVFQHSRLKHTFIKHMVTKFQNTGQEETML